MNPWPYILAAYLLTAVGEVLTAGTDEFLTKPFSLTADPATPRIPVLAATAYAQAGIRNGIW